jgi:cobalt-zinc-cadmium efflux system outer membrane protein
MHVGRWLPLLVLGSTLISGSLHAQPLDEIAATRAVCSSGVENAVAKAQRLRGDAYVLAAQLLPNPSLIVEHQRTFAGAADRETILGVSVPLGIGGRRFLEQDAAQARRRQAIAEARASLFDAALAFREAYVTAAIDEARAQVLSDQQTALDSLSQAIQSLARAGEAASYDGLRQFTQARLHRQLVESAKAKALASRTLLEGWMGREVTLPAAELASLAGGRARSPSAASEDTPTLRGLRAGAQAGELEARAARRRAVPDLALFAGYRAVALGSETGHGVALGLELPLTIFDRGQGEAAQLDAEVRLTRSLLSRLRQHNKARVKAARASLARLEALQAEAVAASRDALSLRDRAARLYAAGEASITELLEAFRAAEDAQLAHVALAQELALTRLGLMRAAGTMFDASLDRECQGAIGEAR